MAPYSAHPRLLLGTKQDPGRLKLSILQPVLFKTRGFDSVLFTVLLTLSGTFLAASEMAAQWYSLSASGLHSSFVFTVPRLVGSSKVEFVFVLVQCCCF